MSDTKVVIREQLTLGELLDLLEEWPLDANVSFDFCGLTPTTVASYRGFYNQLALGFGEPGSMRLSALHENLFAACEARFEGWKGGSFVMTRETKMWADNKGRCSGTRIVGIAIDDYRGGGNADDDGTCVYIRILTRNEGE